MADITNTATPEAESDDGSLSVHDKNVALPEVRTGKVDVDGDFQKEQQAAAHRSISFDTLAVPEYLTGKCPPQDFGGVEPGCAEDACEPQGRKPHEKKHRGLFSDLARTLANGGSEE